jgi:ribose-phosphate pyrophosphokinase
LRALDTEKIVMKLISGTANEPLARGIADVLDIPLTAVDIERFRDQEIFAKINENVRGEDIFLVQPTSAPANDHLMELLILIDALVRASAQRITAVIPYFGYARQDRKTGGRTPISAKLVANLISKAGAHRVLTVDLHAGQIQGFFDIPTDNLFGQPVFVNDIKDRFSASDREKMLFVSPDTGGVVRTRAIAKMFNADIAIVDKRRPKAGESEVMNIIGDVAGRSCILYDDIIDSGGTLCNAAKALKDHGANSVSAYITHGVLSEPAVERITKSELTEVVITDTIAQPDAVKACPKIRECTTSTLLGEAIRRIANDESVSKLFS